MLVNHEPIQIMYDGEDNHMIIFTLELTEGNLLSYEFDLQLIERCLNQLGSHSIYIEGIRIKFSMNVYGVLWMEFTNFFQEGRSLDSEELGELVEKMIFANRVGDFIHEELKTRGNLEYRP